MPHLSPCSSQPPFTSEDRARNKGIPGNPDNPFCCRSTQYHSQGFRRTTSQKAIKICRNMCIVSVHGADYLITICAFLKQYGRGCAACKIMRQATGSIMSYNTTGYEVELHELSIKGKKARCYIFKGKLIIKLIHLLLTLTARGSTLVVRI